MIVVKHENLDEDEDEETRVYFYVTENTETLSIYCDPQDVCMLRLYV